MAFPFVFEGNFETGTIGGWDSKSDTGSLLDYPHISELARFPWSECAPYRGAYCLRVQMGDTNDHTLLEGDIDIAASVTRWFRFYLYLSPTFKDTTADDVFNIFELQQTNNTVEGAIGIRFTAATQLIEIGIGETAPTAYASQTLQTNRWYCIELKAVCDSGVGNDGTLNLYIDGGASAASVTSLDQGTIGQGVLGTQDTLSTTTGTILFDEFVMDDARIGPIQDRYPRHVLVTSSGHVALGRGVIDNVSLLSGGAADNVLSIYDTATAATTDSYKIVVELKNVTSSDIVDPAGMPVHFARGAYVVLTGTNPRAMVNICYASGYGSTAVARNFGQRFRARPGEI